MGRSDTIDVIESLAVSNAAIDAAVDAGPRRGSSVVAVAAATAPNGDDDDDDDTPACHRAPPSCRQSGGGRHRRRRRHCRRRRGATARSSTSLRRAWRTTKSHCGRVRRRRTRHRSTSGHRRARAPPPPPHWLLRDFREAIFTHEPPRGTPRAFLCEREQLLHAELGRRRRAQGRPRGASVVRPDGSRSDARPATQAAAAARRGEGHTPRAARRRTAQPSRCGGRCRDCSADGAAAALAAAAGVGGGVHRWPRAEAAGRRCGKAHAQPAVGARALRAVGGVAQATIARRAEGKAYVEANELLAHTASATSASAAGCRWMPPSAASFAVRTSFGAEPVGSPRAVASPRAARPPRRPQTCGVAARRRRVRRPGRRRRAPRRCPRRWHARCVLITTASNRRTRSSARRASRSTTRRRESRSGRACRRRSPRSSPHVG